ncbi:unnamed protein product [Ostreobium quekettii]|uniref:RNA-editing substrate-binding complex 6 protein domain-containing protein n=1 Tax=Ostreobium quekettii TaxID=121088 RepID=A0A8S1JG69_9CHLO|nr:unnamed protein product [Ostreobium quekettii]
MTDLIALQEPKFNCRNATAMVQRIANVSVKGGVQDFVIQQYGSVLTSLFVLIKAKWKEMDARQISELVWSFARLGSAMLTLRAPPMDLKTVGETTIGNVDAGELFVELVEMSEDYCKDFTPTDVLILVRGIVDMPYPKGYGTAQRLIAGLKSIVTDFNSQDVANLLWCLTKPELGSHDDLLVDVVKHAETLVREFTPQGVANTAWALAKLQCQECETLLAVITTTVEDNLEGFKPQEVANLAWAMARLMYLPRPKFLSRLADLGADRLRLFNFQETCNLLFAFSVFAFQDPGFLAACRAKFLGAGSDVGLRDAMSAVASFAVLDCLDDDIMSWAIQRADDHGFENMNASQRRQLYQGVLHMRLMQPDAQAVAQMPVEVDVTCRASWLDEEERYEPTGTTAEVLQAAQRGDLGECCSQAAFGPESAFCGSTLSTKDGTTFVLGTGDYLRFRNMPKMATGQMKWREKMLATSGLFVLRVDPNEWGAMNSEERKVAYLRRKL